MNFLAHLLLAEPTPESRLGNLLPDFGIRRFRQWRLTPAVQAGIDRHHRVDAFTDHHPLFGASRRRLALEAGRFAGILVDLFYDHMLARHWRWFCAEPLESFIDQVYTDLTAAADLAPAPIRPILASMQQQDWLGCYATAEGMDYVLGRMSQRFTERFGRDVELTRHIALLHRHDEALERDLLAYFPQLLEHIAGPQRLRRSG